MIKLGSLFDGLGGWQIAAVKAGIQPVWSSEIEPFPIKVTDKHFPRTKQLGDITLIDGAKIEPVDIITFGSPCQDLSIAGKREGLDGERSGLFRRAVDIVRQMRNATDGKYPRFIVWENVPGAFSSNKGADFRTVLEEITETEIPIPKSGHYNKDKEWCIEWATAGMVRSNKCEVAWRVLDAQFWGVPQRRKRIFLVADFGGQRAGEILFKPESLCGYSAESQGEGQGTAGNAQNSIGAAEFKPGQSAQARSLGYEVETMVTLSSAANQAVLIRDMTHADEVMRPVKDGIVPTLNARMGTGGNQVPVLQEPVYCIQGSMIGRTDKNGPQGNGINKKVSFTLNTIDRHAVAYSFDSLSSNSMKSKNPHSGCRSVEIAKCLDTAYPDPSKNQGGIGILQPVCICLNDQGGQSINVDYNVSPTLRSESHGNHPCVVSDPVYSMGHDERSASFTPNKTDPLTASDYKQPVIANVGYKVRRLTPTECERLQGLPDGYTLIDDKKCSDSARYKALGNGMAQPCPDFVIKSIAEVLLNDRDNSQS